MPNKLTISQRAESVPPSPIRQLMPLAKQAKEKGIKIYHTNIGDPDFSLPEQIKKELQSTSQTINRMPYPAFRGEPTLLSAWKEYYKSIHIPLEFVDEDMIITAGASDAMGLIAATVADPGDEIIVFEPFFAPYLIYASFVGIKLVPVALDAKTGYHLPTKEEIVNTITPKTKAIFFTNPNNPTGTVFTRDEIKQLLQIAKEHNLFIIGDETYRGLAFDNKESLSLFHLADSSNLDRIVIADSLSKRLNVCGARMGLLLSKNRELVDAAFRFVQGRPYASYVEQIITAPMASNSLEYVSWLTNEYQKRRDAFINTFEAHTGTKVQQPEGAFYAMLQLPITDTNEFARWLLTDFSHNNETVMVSPGAGFYATHGKGLNEVRIAYVLQEKDLKRAAELLAIAVKEYLRINHPSK